MLLSYEAATLLTALERCVISIPQNGGEEIGQKSCSQQGASGISSLTYIEKRITT
jgi:hypothetical protein